MDKKQELTRGEINLIDFMFYCLEKWRWIISCMLIAAIVLGIYKYQDTVEENRYRSGSGAITIEEATEPSVGFYQQMLEEQEHSLELQEAYLKDSIVMQLDPYHVSTGTLSFYMECREHMDGVIAAYRDFVSSGKMAEELYASDPSINVEDLRFLISFVNSIDSTYQMDDELSIKLIADRGSVFQVQIRMQDNDLCESYLIRAEEILMEYSSRLQTNVAEHKLTLLNSVQSEMMDPDIQAYQSSVRSTYKTSVRELQELRTEFEKVESGEGEKKIEITLKNPVSSAVKYAVFGLVFGAGLSCFVLLLLYMLSGRLQDIERFKEEFEMPLLGIIRASGIKRKLFGFVDTWIFQLRGGFYAKISFQEQLKIAASNVQAAISKNFAEGEERKIMLAGTMAEKEAELLCAQLTSEMQTVIASPYMQIVFRSSALKELENYDGILFIEKKGVSDSGLIVQEKKLALDRDVKVLGTIVVC